MRLRRPSEAEVSKREQECTPPFGGIEARLDTWSLVGSGGKQCKFPCVYGKTTLPLFEADCFLRWILRPLVCQIVWRCRLLLEECCLCQLLLYSMHFSECSEYERHVVTGQGRH